MPNHFRSGFLAVVIILSLALAVFVLKAGKSAPPASSSVAVQAPTQEEYRAAVRPIVAEARGAYTEAGTAAEREQALTAALDQLLDVRVPKEEKDLHLELAVSLEQARSGSPSGWKRFLAVVEKTDWLN